MKSKLQFSLCIISVSLSINWMEPKENWLTDKQQNYTLLYTSADENNKKEYQGIIDKGVKSVEVFFNSSFKQNFSVFIHPSRQSLDSTWQKDWNMPAFKSECWMVASGIASKLDIISPKLWDVQSCEHVYSETEKTQQLVTHELVHVYHGQLNVSPDFSNTEGIDWFVEGLAAYASGQCDTVRIGEVKKAVSENKIPDGLDNFWTGQIKYALSGSVVMYIDNKYGRNKLKELLPLNKKTDIFSVLKTTESELLKGWKEYVQKL